MKLFALVLVCPSAWDSLINSLRITESLQNQLYYKSWMSTPSFNVGVSKLSSAVGHYVCYH